MIERDGFARRPIASGVEGSTLALTRTAIRWALPTVVRQRGRSVVIQSLSAERYDVDLESVPGPSAPTTLYRVGYAVLWSRQVREGWRVNAGAQLTMAGDLEGDVGQQLQLTGQLLASRRASPTLEWGIGAAWINVGPGLVPAVLVRWQDGDRQRLEVLPPVRVEYARRIARGVEIGVGSRLVGGRFRRGADEAAGADEVDLLELVAGPWASAQIGAFVLRVDAGTTAVRQFELRAVEGPSTAERELDAERGGWLRLSAAARF